MGIEKNLSAPSYDAQVTQLKRTLAGARAAADDAGARTAAAELAALTGRREPGAEPVERAVAQAPETATSPRPRRAAAPKRKDA